MILAIGDLHIDPNAAYSRPTADGLTTYLHEIRDWLALLAKTIEERKPTLVVFLGDIFDKGSRIDARALQVASEGFRIIDAACERAGSRFRVLLGNHDIVNHSVDALSFISPDAVIGEVARDEFPELDLSVLYVPYPDDMEVLRKDPKLRGDVGLVFCHAPMVGGRYGDNMVEREGLTALDFPANPYIIMGHYHRPVALPSVDSPSRIVWAGASAARTFSDSIDPANYIPHGAVMIRRNLDGLTSFGRLENPYTSRYVKVEVNNEPTLDGLRELAQRPDADRMVVRAMVIGSLVSAVTPLAGSFRHLEVVGQQEVVSTTVPARQKQADPVAVLEHHLAVEAPKDVDPAVLREIVAKIELSDTERAGGVLAFRRVDIKDFLSLGNVRLRLDQPGLTLVEGVNADDPGSTSNGSGKSSVFEAIYWAIYGVTIRGLTGDSVIRRQAKSCMVMLDLEVDGVPYTITRTRNHPKLGTGVVFSSGMDMLSSRKANETQLLIEATVGIPKATYQLLYYLSAGLDSRFTQLGDADRKRLLEQIVRLGKYDMMHKQLYAKDSSLSDSLRYTEASLELSVQQADAIKARLEQSTSWLVTFDAESSARRTALSEEVSRLAQDLSTLASNATALETQMQGAHGERERLRLHYEDVTKAFREASMAHAALSSECRTVRAEALRLADLMNRKCCPTCGQSTDGPGLVRTALESAENVAQSFERRLQESTLTLGEREKATTDVGTAHRAASLEHDKITARLFGVNSEIAQVKGLKGDREAKIESIERERELIVRDIDKARSDLAMVEANNAAAKADIEKLRDQARHLGYLVKAYAPNGPLRQFAFQSAIDYLNSRLSHYSSGLLGDRVVSVSSTTELKSKETAFRVDIRLSGDRPYQSLSSGERRRLDLCLQFGLRDLMADQSCQDSNLLVCDEIDNTLDESGLEALVQVLSGIAEDKAVFLVTHHGTLKAMTQRRITVRKQDGLSEVVV